MLKSKYDNPLDPFVIHGSKTVGDFVYYLLVDEQGQGLIQQVASDESTSLFCEMTPLVNPTKAQIATAITAFWGGTIQNYAYVYLYQLQ